jgi:hypothetical protein
MWAYRWTEPLDQTLVSVLRGVTPLAHPHLPNSPSFPAPRSIEPRTNEGKGRSSQNSRTHGLNAAQFVIAAAEDREEFDDLHARLHGSLPIRLLRKSDGWIERRTAP